MTLLAVLYLFLLAVVLAIGQDVGRAGVEQRQQVGAARLVVLTPGQTGLEPGEALALQPVTRLGRSGSNTIVLGDSFVSSEHAVISYRDGGGWCLSDRGSTNGTLLNDQPVTGEASLAPGDVIAIGQIRLQVTT